MVEFSGLFSDEVEEFKNKAKSEEEIQKYCTKEDLTELQRGVHLLKKGFEVQKLSVINNLDRYMKEIGANDDLLALIIGSLDDWDDKMQIECAKAFVTPLKSELVSLINKQRMLRLCVEIVTDQERDNKELSDAWFEVFETVVGRVSIDYVEQYVIKGISDLPNPKNPMPKRKLGNRLFSGIAKAAGEKALDEVPQVITTMVGICQDPSYKIRLDGVCWLKDYLCNNHKELLGTERFDEVYLPEIVELLNDESSDVRIEAVEGILCVLQHLDAKMIEDEFIPNLIKALNFEKNAEENIQRMAKLIGEIAFKLSSFGLHLKYQDQILSFYKRVCESEDEFCRKQGLFNLPCFHSLYKDIVKRPPGTAATMSTNATTTPQNEDNLLVDTSLEESKEQKEAIELDFIELYSNYADDQNPEVREVVAACIHEPFMIMNEFDDLSVLQQTVQELMEEQERDVVAALSTKIDIIIERYCNQHTLNTIRSGTDPKSPSGQNENIKGGFSGLQYSTSIGTGKLTAMEFGGEKATKKGGIKKQSTVNFDQDTKEGDAASSNSQYLILPEFASEKIYSELLQKLVIYNTTVHGIIGLWRDHAQFLENFSKHIHRFHVPEVHDIFVPILFNLIQNGNNTLRLAVAKCIVQILIHQHDNERRMQLTKQILTELAEAGAFTMRKCFLNLCRIAAGQFSRQFFLEHFFQTFIKMASDKVPHVRIDFAKALVEIKPWLEPHQDQQMELNEKMNVLRDDQDQDVADSCENTDFELLKSRKALSAKYQMLEEKCIARENQLIERAAKDTEERKRRQEEEDENKFDLATFLMDNRKQSIRNKGRASVKNRGVGGTQSKNAGATRTIAASNAALMDKTPTKRKNGVTKRNSSALPSVGELGQTGKTDKADRKNSVLLPSSNTIIDKNNRGAPDNVPGGMDNYKRYQMLVQAQQAAGSNSTLNNNTYKRSLSLLDNSGKAKLPPKRTTTMDNQNRKRTNKITTDEDSDDNTPSGKRGGTGATFGTFGTKK